jgi:alkanesulfonate monooxygenase SsuD/methylene tetrahydromethanopterin reductase-like flavin-dependent oxidoreductase (luciferase family)
MEIGIGLPTQVANLDGRTLVGWAKQAEADGFASLGTVGRLVYPNYDDLIALSAAAGVTERIRLTTSVLLAPLHANVALLAKQTASLDRLSGGRLVLGIGTGGRDDDFTASGLPTKARGQHLAEQVEELRRIWRGEERGTDGPIGPAPVNPGGPPLILGAYGPVTFRRMAGLVDGWIMGGGTPETYLKGAAAFDQAWKDAGRPGKPRKLSLTYFALGDEAVQEAVATIKRYYAWLGPYADQIAAGMASSPEMVKAYVEGFRESGCDEVIFGPGSGRIDQVSRLKEAIA